jgi:hypothetical protein
MEVCDLQHPRIVGFNRRIQHLFNRRGRVEHELPKERPTMFLSFGDMFKKCPPNGRP